jgi:hypothetical protein
MDSLLSPVFSLFVLLTLRCFIPVALTLGLAWLLKHWREGNQAATTTMGPGSSDSPPQA